MEEYNFSTFRCRINKNENIEKKQKYRKRIN